MNTIIGDIIRHMTPDRAYEDYYAQLQSVVSKVLAHIRDFSSLFSLVRLKPCSHVMFTFASNIMNRHMATSGCALTLNVCVLKKRWQRLRKNANVDVIYEWIFKPNLAIQHCYGTRKTGNLNVHISRREVQ